MRKLTFLLALLPSLAAAQSATSTVRVSYDMIASRYASIISVPIHSLGHFLGSRKTLDVGGVTGFFLDNGAPIAGFDLTTQWHIADKTNVIAGFVVSASAGQKPRFFGIEVGIGFDIN